MSIELVRELVSGERTATIFQCCHRERTERIDNSTDIYKTHTH